MSIEGAKFMEKVVAQMMMKKKRRMHLPAKTLQGVWAALGGGVVLRCLGA